MKVLQGAGVPSAATIEVGTFRQLIWTGLVLAVASLALLSSYRSAPRFAPSSVGVTSTSVTNPRAAVRQYGASGSQASTSSGSGSGSGSTSGGSSSGIVPGNVLSSGEAATAFDSVAGQ